MSARGINSTTQTEYRYDKLGNLFWTNADTGTPRVYVYDASGNAVIEVSQANGTSLSALTSPTAVKNIDPAQVQMKFSVYDARNLITDVFQAPMDFTGLTGQLTVSQQQQLANSNSSSPGSMQWTQGSNPPLISDTQSTLKVQGGSYTTWYDATTGRTTTYLNPTTVSSAQGQTPISLAPTDTITQISPNTTRRVQRTAYYDAANPGGA